MTLELDVEIAEQSGFKFWCASCCSIKGMDDDTHMYCWPGIQTPPRYSSDLNALMALVRERWPMAEVRLGDYYAILAPKGWTLKDGIEYDGDKAFGKGTDDCDRLAHAVRETLRASKDNE